MPEKAVILMNTCYIIGAGEKNKIEIKRDDNDLIICADGGLKYAREFLLEPDLIVGDFDSYGTVPSGKNVIVHPCEKNETDTHLAINIALEKGYRKFVMFCMLGGRLDHTFANIELLSFLCNNGAHGILIGNGQKITMIKNGSINFSEKEKGIISVFSFSEKSENVNIKGLKYEVENFELSSSYPRGVSNEFIGKEATVSTDKGELLIIYESK